MVDAAARGLYNLRMSSIRVIDCALVALTIATLTVVGSEAALAALHQNSLALWTANFVLLIAAVVAALPLATYVTYRSWLETKRYLV
jgi:hypothetical protein